MRGCFPITIFQTSWPLWCGNALESVALTHESTHPPIGGHTALFNELRGDEKPPLGYGGLSQFERAHVHPGISCAGHGNSCPVAFTVKSILRQAKPLPPRIFRNEHVVDSTLYRALAFAIRSL